MGSLAASDDHGIISPAILYWGTPVVLISSENEDGSSNLSPMSSAWWLGKSCVLGLAAENKTTQNMLRTKQCVLNLADDSMVDHINALADTTGTNPLSASKQNRNYRYVKDKWAKAGLHPQESHFVRPQRIQECQVQMECEVVDANPLFKDLPDRSGLCLAVEVRVLRTHVVERLRMVGHPNRIDADQWKPAFMMFQDFYGLGHGKLGESVLGRISEEKYRVIAKSDAKSMPGDKDDEIVKRQYAKY